VPIAAITALVVIAEIKPNIKPKKFPVGSVYFSSFGAGFLSGSLSSYLGSSRHSKNMFEMIGNTVRDAVVGGTISVIGAAKVFIEPDSHPGLYCILPLAPILPPLSSPIPTNKAALSPAPWAALALPVGGRLGICLMRVCIMVGHLVIVVNLKPNITLQFML
jgi:hypothetical protein